MRLIGFSTGALKMGDFRSALRILSKKGVRAVELSALRSEELLPLVEALDELKLTDFQYISFHAPSHVERDFETVAIRALQQVARRRWPIIVHPDAMHEPPRWAVFEDLLCIENMDKRKPIGQSVAHLREIFQVLPHASFCFDIGHARQVDPTMSEATAMLQFCRDRLREVHISEVNSQSKHDPLSFGSVLAFRKVARLIPEGVPVIVESRVQEQDVEDEILSAQKSLSIENALAYAGD